MRRLAIALACAAVSMGALAPGAAIAQTTPSKLEDLWKQYPLDEDGSSAPPSTAPGPATPAPAEGTRSGASPAPAPGAGADPQAAPAENAAAPSSPEEGTEWLPVVILIVSVLVLSVALLDFARGRRSRRTRYGTAAASERFEVPPASMTASRPPAAEDPFRAVPATAPEPAETTPVRRPPPAAPSPPRAATTQPFPRRNAPGASRGPARSETPTGSPDPERPGGSPWGKP